MGPWHTLWHRRSFGSEKSGSCQYKIFIKINKSYSVNKSPLAGAVSEDFSVWDEKASGSLLDKVKVNVWTLSGPWHPQQPRAGTFQLNNGFPSWEELCEKKMVLEVTCSGLTSTHTPLENIWKILYYLRLSPEVRVGWSGLNTLSLSSVKQQESICFI